MKKFFTVIFVSLLLCLSRGVWAVGLNVNGVDVVFSESDGAPFIENGRTLVPLRAASEAYGASVNYDAASRTAVVAKDGVTVEVPVGESCIYRNGEKIKVDTPAKIVNSRTYLPIRMVMEALGAEVGWNQEKAVVTVADPDVMFIKNIENGGKKQGPQIWSNWNSALSMQNAGNYSGAIEAYKALATEFITQGASNSALLFQHLGECYAKLGQYHNASLCYSRSAYYWEKDPGQSETALHYSNLAGYVDSGVRLYLKTSDKAYDRTKYFGAPNEPESGIVLGAYAESDPVASSSYSVSSLYFHGFPRLTGKDHGAYLLYFTYGEDISAYDSHFKEAARLNKIIEVGLQPRWGLEQVQYDEYLINTAKYMENSGCRFLLRFANEMNDSTCAWYTTDYNKYIEKFRIVASVFKEYAPSVGIVWAPNFYPSNNIDLYYPGDEYVDYVGLSVYEEYSSENDPLGEGIERSRWSAVLDSVYETYGDRKPIIISEGGCSYLNIRTGGDLTDFAANQMIDYYTYLPIKYPNLKLAVLFDANEQYAAPGYFPRRFLLSANEILLNAYKQ
ncbi:MAG: stalk domain-containing protein, partial [Clostridia bacterium]